MREHAVERTRDVVEIDRIDEQARVAQLAAVGAAHEAPQLSVEPLSPPRRLLLERPERAEVAFGLDDGLDEGRAERTDQLVLQVGDADVEAEPLHVGAGELGAEAGPLETAPVDTSSSPSSQRPASRTSERGSAEARQEAPDRLGAPDRDDRDALGIEIPAAPRRERLERDLVADSLG